MFSVTKRVNMISQPKGGILPIKMFFEEKLEDNLILQKENLSPVIIGLAVDYLSRYMSNGNVLDSFKISLLGSSVIHEEKLAKKLINSINGLDDDSIISACKLVGFDVCFRLSISGYKDVRTILPDKATINNIRILVNRCVNFEKKYGPVIADGLTFEGGYTDIISSGDCDFITKDTLWDMKVSVNKPKSTHTLQLLVYYLMGIHSSNKEFNNIKRIGIFNPRLNCVYICDIKDISEDIISYVENEVIGYNIANENTLTEEDVPELLTITDIMKYLKCSRSKVMNLYTSYGLPLFKEKNRYYIYTEDFIEWYDQYEKQQKINTFISSIFTVIFIVILLIIIIMYM